MIEIMSIDKFLRQLTPDLYRILRKSLELGKWPDGQSLQQDQREAALQALIIYEHKHIPETERIGYMPQKSPKSKPVQSETSGKKNIIRFNV